MHLVGNCTCHKAYHWKAFELSFHLAIEIRVGGDEQKTFWWSLSMQLEFGLPCFHGQSEGTDIMSHSLMFYSAFPCQHHRLAVTFITGLYMRQFRIIELPQTLQDEDTPDHNDIYYDFSVTCSDKRSSCLPRWLDGLLPCRRLSAFLSFFVFGKFKIIISSFHSLFPLLKN